MHRKVALIPTGFPLPRFGAKGVKQSPWKDDMPTQHHYCKYNKGCCWATRIRGHGNRGAFNVPESIMLLLPHNNASLQQSCPLMYHHPYSPICSVIITFSASLFPPLLVSLGNNLWLLLWLVRGWQACETVFVSFTQRLKIRGKYFYIRENHINETIFFFFSLGHCKLCS